MSDFGHCAVQRRNFYVCKKAATKIKTSAESASKREREREREREERERERENPPQKLRGGSACYFLSLFPSLSLSVEKEVPRRDCNGPITLRGGSGGGGLGRGGGGDGGLGGGGGGGGSKSCRHLFVLNPF